MARRKKDTPTFNGPALYLDGGKRITTHSMLKTHLRCPKQTQYKYKERLKPRFVTMRDKPLKRGTWFHGLLEVHYVGGNWKDKHAEYVGQFNRLMDEEKEALGNLPVEMADMMRSYLWHYGGDKTDPFHGWEVLDTEVTLECPWPDSPDGLDVYRCRVDIMYRDEFGLWIGDHKTHKTLPDITSRILDAASPLYIWCARENGYPVDGFVWNYIRAKAPSKPKMTQKTQRLSEAAMDTDYPTMVRGLRELGLDPAEYKDRLRPLWNQRYKHGEVQSSPFFRRDTLEKDDATMVRAVGAAMRTRDNMHGYDFTYPDTVERSVDRTCSWMCSYTDLCTTELFGGDAASLRRRTFRIGDPLDYYQEEKDTEPVS